MSDFRARVKKICGVDYTIVWWGVGICGIQYVYDEQTCCDCLFDAQDWSGPAHLVQSTKDHSIQEISGDGFSPNRVTELGEMLETARESLSPRRKGVHFYKTK